MSDDKTYNGWTNYETWNVNLWLDNDAGDYRYWRDAARECYDDATDTPSANAKLTGREPFTTKERATFALADLLKETMEENAPDLGASMYSDLLSAALSEVNWQEIASHWLDEYDDEPAAEDEETDEE